MNIENSELEMALDELEEAIQGEDNLGKGSKKHLMTLRKQMLDYIHSLKGPKARSKRERLEDDIILNYQKVFDAIPGLTKIPLGVFGRYGMYEITGEPMQYLTIGGDTEFEDFIEEYNESKWANDIPLFPKVREMIFAPKKEDQTWQDILDEYSLPYDSEELAEIYCCDEKYGNLLYVEKLGSGLYKVDYMEAHWRN